MSVIPVVVRWNGKKFDVELDTAATGEELKLQIYSLTGVTPDRQKVMIKGGLLKDDTDLSKLNIKPGHAFMMMGTVGELPKAPTDKTVFLEDLSDADLAKALKLPTGLSNIGNTCYANSTIQCLRAIPELRKGLENYTGKPNAGGDDRLANSMGALFRNLRANPENVVPIQFIETLRQTFPKFAEQGQGGIYAQQDAEECWSDIVTSLKSQVNINSGEGQGDPLIDRYMMGEMETTLKCDEAPEEEVIRNKEAFLKLDCHISQSVNYLENGLGEGLKGTLEKNSPSLGRSAIYTREGKISRLPAYLTVHFVRFFWKQQERIKSKILRNVKYPLDLDLYSFCTPELQERMSGPRTRLREEEDKIKAKSSTMNAEEEKELLEKDTAIPLERDGMDTHLVQDIGCNPTGQYTLSAVLTHEGRGADAGHYIAWVRKALTDEWIKYDDNKVSMTNTEAVLKMHGGGDGHIAFICLYKRKAKF
ncbi:MAG: hypothetical protein DHS80DRAFT_31640 [Piptocephalis tieghemiana]|nr:MAG: hypothetical protein DHS80DRAFT_31640 [Piptocephalis tieghemiana]